MRPGFSIHKYAGDFGLLLMFKSGSGLIFGTVLCWPGGVFAFAFERFLGFCFLLVLSGSYG